MFGVYPTGLLQKLEEENGRSWVRTSYSKLDHLPVVNQEKNGETWNNRLISCAAYYAIRARPASLHVLFQSSNSPGGRKLNLALVLTEVKTNFSTTSTVYD